MKEIIDNICKLLADSSFKDEQQMRFSLVGRICDCLGWDIRNPNEFYTECPVKRYSPQEIKKALIGRIDVAIQIHCDGVWRISA
ncbi:MAG: hypothetical protein RBS43_01730 [Candidatus Cloacimonas sp.]|nr:hypothetical protein [Candidatus Cloacimonas sp.]